MILFAYKEHGFCVFYSDIGKILSGCNSGDLLEYLANIVFGISAFPKYLFDVKVKVGKAFVHSLDYPVDRLVSLLVYLS